MSSQEPQRELGLKLGAMNARKPFRAVLQPKGARCWCCLFEDRVVFGTARGNRCRPCTEHLRTAPCPERRRATEAR